VTDLSQYSQVAQHFSQLQNIHTINVANPALYSVGKRVLSWRQSSQNVKSAIHLHLLQRSRKNETIPLLPLHAFMSQAGKTLPFFVP
jgi:hypothetical protein